MEKAIAEVLNEMAEVLSADQLRKLQQVMLRKFCENRPKAETTNNAAYQKMFLMQKRLRAVLPARSAITM